MAEDLTPAQRRADALALLAESALAANFDGGTAGDRYQVVLHVNADDAVDTRIESSTPGPSPAAIEGVVEVDHGALYVSAETSQRLSCDASVVHMRHDADGAVLDVGRKTRTIPPSIRRALAARDTGCRCPGCTSRRCDAHHVEHWADGGATSLDNLVLLCRRHTRFDLPWAIDVRYRGPVVPKNLARKKEGGCGRCGNRSVVSKERVGALPG